MSEHDHQTEHAHHVQFDVEGDDPFFAHTPEEMHSVEHAHAEVANARMISGIGVIGFLLVAATSLIVYGYFRWYTVQMADRNVSEVGASGVERDFWLDGGLRHVQTRWYADAEPRWLEPDPAIPGDEPTLQLPMQTAIDKTIDMYAGR